jgi:ABC-type multidrug transport system ATPase subunit
VLILDEPASGLDPRARVELRELLRELRSLGKTIVISSHILPELEELCTSLAIIDAGRVLAQGSLAEIEARLRVGAVLRVRVLGDTQDVEAARAHFALAPGWSRSASRATTRLPRRSWQGPCAPAFGWPPSRMPPATSRSSSCR